VRFGYYTSVILLSSANLQPWREAAQYVTKIVANAGFSARVESVNAVEAYLGSMPGNLFANVRRPLVNTLNLAHLLPLTAIWAGPDVHPCFFYSEHSAPLLQAKTDGATPYLLCLHAGDLGHTAIIGPTGSGKSTLLATLVAQHFRYPGAQAFVLDKGYSMFPLVAAAGGQHYDIAGESDNITFCPLGQIDGEVERSWAAQWLESLAELQGVAMSPELRKELFRAVNQLAASTDCAEQRTLSNFLLTLQDRFDWLFDCGRATVTFGLFLCVNGRERFRVGCNNLEQCARRTCGTHSPLFPVLQGLGFDANQVSKTALRQAGVFANRLHVGFRQLLNAHAMHLLATHVPSHVLHTAE